MRTIRSFVQRQTRFTTAQRAAWESLWPQYGLTLGDAPLVLPEVFGNDQPTTLEIGFGDGQALVAYAQANPMHNVLGIDVYRPGVGQLLIQLQKHQLGNVRLLCDDAAVVLADHLLPKSLQAVHLFFPDPWPKKRHHKRRMVQATWLDQVHRALLGRGLLHIATDWRDYAEHTNACLQAHPGFEMASLDLHQRRVAQRPKTKFERRGLKLGHEIWDICCVTRFYDEAPDIVYP